MKKLSFVVLAAAFAAIGAHAATQQFDPSVVVSATKDANGNVTVAWTDPMKVKAVEHYIGHGQKSGFINVIDVGGAKKVVLKDIAKNGGRFNLVGTNGKYLHLECGGNLETVMPTFKGVGNDCSFEVNGEKVGALVVQ